MGPHELEELGDDRDAIAHGPTPSYERMRRLDALRHGWRVTARRAASYQFEILISLVYYLLLGPGMIASRLTGARPIDPSPRPRWHHRDAGPATVRDL